MAGYRVGWNEGVKAAAALLDRLRAEHVAAKPTARNENAWIVLDAIETTCASAARAVRALETP